jgi:hypothetical protein
LMHVEKVITTDRARSGRSLVRAGAHQASSLVSGTEVGFSVESAAG